MELNTRVTQNSNIDATDINGDKVMMDLEKGKYFAMNTISSKIWDIIYKPTTIKEIVDKLRSEYEVEENHCINSVITFIEKLKKLGLVEIL